MEELNGLHCQVPVLVGTEKLKYFTVSLLGGLSEPPFPEGPCDLEPLRRHLALLSAATNDTAQMVKRASVALARHLTLCICVYVFTV